MPLPSQWFSQPIVLKDRKLPNETHQENNHPKVTAAGFVKTLVNGDSFDIANEPKEIISSIRNAGSRLGIKLITRQIPGGITRIWKT